MISRRDIVVAVSAACATMAAVAWAQTTAPPVMRSSIFKWDDMQAKPTASGVKREVLKAPVATLDQLQLHVTTVGPHQKAHEPHKHPEEELIIVKEGMIDAMQNGETTRVGPGSVIFEASNELHGLINAGDMPATYYVIKWFSPGTMPAKAN
jgi:XRE family transcriptional regulator, regulator of sulfur utilization